jgi:hypothetical protein
MIIPALASYTLLSDNTYYAYILFGDWRNRDWAAGTRG